VGLAVEGDIFPDGFSESFFIQLHMAITPKTLYFQGFPGNSTGGRVGFSVRFPQ